MKAGIIALGIASLAALAAALYFVHTEPLRENPRFGIPPLVYDVRTPNGLSASTALVAAGANSNLGNYLVIPADSDAGAITHTPSVVFTRDGKSRLVSASNGKVVIFDDKDAISKTLAVFKDSVSTIAVDQKRNILIAVSRSGELKSIDLKSGRETHSMKIDGALYVSANESKAVIAVAGANGISILDTLKLAETKQIQCGAVNAVAFDEKGELLAAGLAGNAGTAVFETEKYGETYRVQSDSSNTYSLAFSPDSAQLATGGNDRIIKIWSARNGKCLKEHLDEQPYFVTALGFSPCGKYLAVGDESCDVWEYQTGDWKRIMHAKHHNECWLQSIAWSPDSETFLFGCRPNSYNESGSLQTADPDIYTAMYNSKDILERQKKVQELAGELSKLEPELKVSAGQMGGYGGGASLEGIEFADKVTGGMTVTGQSMSLGISSSSDYKIISGTPKTEAGKKLLDKITAQQNEINAEVQKRAQEAQKNFCVKQFKHKK